MYLFRWTSLWSFIPGIPNAALNPHGVLGTWEETLLGSILRSREAVYTQSHRILPGCSPDKHAHSGPLQCQGLLVFPHPRQHMILSKIWGFWQSDGWKWYPKFVSICLILERGLFFSCELHVNILCPFSRWMSSLPLHLWQLHSHAQSALICLILTSSH